MTSQDNKQNTTSFLEALMRLKAAYDKVFEGFIKIAKEEEKNDRTR